MINKLIKYVLVCVFFQLLSCGNMERLDTSQLKEEMKTHKIKKVSEAEILSTLNENGTRVAKLLNISDCDLQKSRLDSLVSVPNFKIEAIEPESYRATTDLEKQLMEALQFSLEGKTKFEPTPQKLSDSEYAFYFSNEPFNCPESNKPFWKITYQKDRLIQSMNN